ncbi:MAG: hypothetical protein ACR2OX_08930 [Methyloligellaceae bacterium]
MLTRSFSFLGGLAIGVFLIWPAAAAEFCVSCTGPDQTYLCVIDPQSGSGANNNAALQLYCVVNTARDRGHQSCKVRKVAGNRCDGPRLDYAYSGSALPMPLSPNSTPVPYGGAVSEGSSVSQGQSKKTGEAETFVEFTNKAIKSSRQRLRKAGENVGTATNKTRASVRGAAKKTTRRVGTALKNAGKAVGRAARTTIHCVRTLFGECRGRQTDEPDTGR